MSNKFSTYYTTQNIRQNVEQNAVQNSARNITRNNVFNSALYKTKNSTKSASHSCHSDTPRMIETIVTDANAGKVIWSPVKSVWYLLHALVALVGGYITFSWDALLVFTLFTGLTLCLGHSLGMHRRLIHNSYQCPLWLEYFFVYLGSLVGMAGPLGMMHQHDLRDWAQRQRQCHPYLRHGNSFSKDGWQQLNCDLVLDNAPVFEPEERVKNNNVYVFMEKTWMWQQLPWALVLFYFGGIAWIVWGISARIFVSITGHWLVGHFAHNKGHRDWHINGAAAQGYNIKFAGFLSMGESWHNNHHAYPGSAMLGLYKGQSDPGFWVLNVLHNLGYVWDIKLPQDLAYRPELVLFTESETKLFIVKPLKEYKVLDVIM